MRRERLCKEVAHVLPAGANAMAVSSPAMRTPPATTRGRRMTNVRGDRVIQRSYARRAGRNDLRPGVIELESLRERAAACGKNAVARYLDLRTLCRQSVWFKGTQLNTGITDGDDSDVDRPRLECELDWCDELESQVRAALDSARRDDGDGSGGGGQEKSLELAGGRRNDAKVMCCLNRCRRRRGRARWRVGSAAGERARRGKRQYKYERRTMSNSAVVNVAEWHFVGHFSPLEQDTGQLISSTYI